MGGRPPETQDDPDHPNAAAPPAPRPSSRGLSARPLFIGFGFLFVGLGAIGIVLPGLPTTPFMLLAAWMFSKSSPRFHAWLWNHPMFGRYVRDWSEHRVIPMHAKVLSSSFMVAGLATLVARQVPPVVLVLATGLCVWGAWFVWRRPSRPSPQVDA